MIILERIRLAAYLHCGELPWQCPMPNVIFKLYPSIVETQLSKVARLWFHFTVGLKWFKVKLYYIFTENQQY